VDAATDLQLASFQVDVLPLQPAELARPESREDCCQDERPPSLWRRIDDCPQFLPRGHCGARVLPAVRVRRAPYRIGRRLPDVVDGDETPALRRSDDGRERSQNALYHIPGSALLSQLVCERVDGGHGEPSKLRRSEIGYDM